MLRLAFAILGALALTSGARAQVPINPSNLPLVTQTARGAVPQTGTPTGKLLVDSGLWSSTITAPTIAGGTMDGAAIGLTTPASGAFTSLSATGTLTIGPSSANPLTMTNATWTLTGSGSAGYTFRTLTTGNMVFQVNSQGVLTLRQATNGVNGITLTEGATGAGAQIQQGGDSPGVLKLGAGAGGNTGSVQTLVPLLVQGSLSFGLTQTLVSGSALGPVGSTNAAPLWYNSTLQGTLDTGAGSPFEFQVTDKMVMVNPLPIWAFTLNTAAGYDGARDPFSITLVKNAPTLSGNIFGSNTVLTVTQNIAVGDGGTQAAPNGTNTAMNFVLRCHTGDWLLSCVESEWDHSLEPGTHAVAKVIVGLHYSQFDGAHASGTTANPLRWTDATLQMTAATTMGNGTGKGIVMWLLGDHSQDIPWDTTPGIGTALMAVQMNDSQNFPTAMASGAQIDDGFRLVDVFVRNNFINNGSFRVDGQGNVYSCGATLKATSTGSSLDVTGQTEMSAIPTTPITTGAVVGSTMTDSLGGIWQVSAVAGTFPNTNPTAVTPLRPACVGTPPANPITANMSGGGVSGGTPPVSLTVTWSGPRTTLTLQPSGGQISMNGQLNTIGISDTSASGGTTFPGGGPGILTTGDISSNQTIANWSLATQPHKSQGFFTTMTTIGTANQDWENFDSVINWNGQTTIEMNTFHGIISAGSGATMVNGEAFESTFNGTNATVSGLMQNYLAQGTLNSGSINQLAGFSATYANPGGSIAEYDAFLYNGVSGTAPTKEYVLRNNSATALIATLGDVYIGSVTPIAASNALSIKSNGTTSATHAVSIQNSANGNLFDLNDAASLTVYNDITSGSNGGNPGKVVLKGSTSGGAAFILSNQSAAALYNIAVPDSQADTIALIGLSQTFSANPTFSGNVNFTSSIQYQGFVGVSATAPTIQSGFGTGATVANARGTKRFQVNVGTGGTASTGVVGMPLTNQGWVCTAVDTNGAADNNFVSPTGTSNITITNYGRTTGTATPWAASTIIWLNCDGG